eukprot:g1852.t1
MSLPGAKKVAVATRQCTGRMSAIVPIHGMKVHAMEIAMNFLYDNATSYGPGGSTPTPSPSSSSDDDSFPMWLIGVVVGGVVAIIVIAVVYAKCRSTNRH